MRQVLAIFTLLLAVVGIYFLSSFINSGNYQAYAYHSQSELGAFNALAAKLPTGMNSIFAASGECENCHGTAGNGPNTTALQDANGKDVSPVADWKATMMANSAKDPFWRAKVTHEGLVNPAHKTVLETTCTKCHAPNGAFNAIHNGQPHYTIADLEQDSIGLDGTSCTSCHAMLPNNFGSTFSADITYDTTKTVYGPYSNPFTNPMQNMIGFTPAQGNHINNSRLCGKCHTLITNTADLSGNLTGGTFVEQAIYHEWLNSNFSPNNNTSCQDCHMPRINDNVVISDRPPWLNPRTPFGKHELVGGNAFMLSILRNNIDTLGLSANQTEFDTVIQRTIKHLQTKTLDVSLVEAQRTNDTVFYEVELTNKTGHKFPAGYPSRRAYVDFVVKKANGDTLFYSGRADGQFRLLDEDATYEPHYDMINSPSQVQIYEMVMGDVNSNVTTVLERADVHLKDNRLPPAGFTTTHNAYDTVKIVGNAFNDSNFNKNGPTEGTGKDKIYFHIPLNGYTGTLISEVSVFYQPVPPKWTDDMFSYTSPEIDLFESMYNNANHIPVKVAVAHINGPVGINENNNTAINIFPNPTSKYVNLQNLNNVSNIKLYTLAGKLVQTYKWNQKTLQRISLPTPKGVYILHINLKTNTSVTKRLFHY